MPTSKPSGNRIVTTIVVSILFSAIPLTGFAQTRNIILKSDKIEITEEMLEFALDALPPDVRNTVNAEPKRIAEFLKTLLTNKTLAKEAQETKLDASPMVIAELAAAKESIIARARLREFEQQIVAPNYTNQAREIYITQSEKYTIAPDIDTSHILIRTQCRTEKEALRLAAEIRAKIIAGATFEAMAIELSEDGAVKKNKGNLGNQPADSLSKAYSAGALALGIGEISQPIVSEFGVHIIKLNKLKVGRKITFDEAKSGIIAGLEAKYKSEQRNKKLNGIEFDPSVTINTDLLNLRRQRAQQPPGLATLQAAPQAAK